MPGIEAVRIFRRATTTAISSRRSPRGFSVITRRPTLVVGLTEPAPITDTTPVTSGSFLMASAASVCRLCISAKDTSGPASVTAVIEAVSCSGRKPFGATMYMATIAATVAMYIVAPKGFLPLQDTASITAVTEAGPDVSFAEMQSRQTEAADAIKNDPDVTGVVSVIGAGSVNPTTNVGRLVMTLKPRGERRDDIAVVVARLKMRTASIPGMTIYFQ